MRLEVHSSAAIAPLMALVGACSGEPQASANVAAIPIAPKAPASPLEAAQQAVRQRLGAEEPLQFSETRVFDSGGATIVCGRVSRSGQAPQRFIAVGGEDLFVESQMQPGHMAQAANEFCRDA